MPPPELLSPLLSVPFLFRGSGDLAAKMARVVLVSKLGSFPDLRSNSLSFIFLTTKSKSFSSDEGFIFFSPIFSSFSSLRFLLPSATNLPLSSCFTLSTLLVSSHILLFAETRSSQSCPLFSFILSFSLGSLLLKSKLSAGTAPTLQRENEVQVKLDPGAVLATGSAMSLLLSVNQLNGQAQLRAATWLVAG